MTIDNVSAAVSLVKVAQASQQLITAAAGYAKGVTNSSKFHIQLESQLQRIVAASNLALGAVNKSSSLSNDPDIDPRLVEWLSSNGPDKCLDTLKAMQRLLQDRPLSQQLFSIIPSVSKHEGFHQAITLFNEHRANFHFLLTMDIWNNGKGGQRHKEAPNGPVDIDEGSKNVQRGQSEVGGGRTTIGNKLSVGRRERKKEVDRKDVERFLRWLNGLTCTRKHEDTCALRQAETCTWLPETETYQSWRCGDSPFLWLKGKPGSGKSVLASSVIDQLKSSLRDGEVLAFFYCDFRNERSTSAAEVMRSLLTQLLRLANADGVDCRDAVPELVERKAEGTEPPCDMKLLTCLVRHVAQQLHRQPLIVIDALDECKDAEKLVHAVKQLNDGHIRVFVTSRPERIIMETLFDLPSISLQNMGGAVSADMKRHITIELDSRQWLRILKPALKQEIHFALLARADGMQVLRLCMTISGA
ncbi:hypothetical protein BDN67DRAFT_1011775 [Paxillus ammoniavirescens]|nr:hypothetical protein BDN67DRAFT_1011775 [Paxillus ammoniavirescens]